MYKMENVLYNVSVTPEAGGSWKVGDESSEGGTERKRGAESRSEEGMESQGVGIGGRRRRRRWEGRRVGGGDSATVAVHQQR